MEIPQDWIDKDWLTFLLLNAGHADGYLDAKELRMIEVKMGQERVKTVSEFRDGLDEVQRMELIKNGVGVFLATPDARQQLQALMRQLFLADGEYSAPEQVLWRQIGVWIKELES